MEVPDRGANSSPAPYHAVQGEDPFNPQYLPLLKQVLAPDEFAKFCAYRTEYASFRRGNAHGSKGEVAGLSSVQAVATESAPYDPDVTSLEEAVVGLFKAPDPSAAMASMGRESVLQERLSKVRTQHALRRSAALPLPPPAPSRSRPSSSTPTWSRPRV